MRSEGSVEPEMRLAQTDGGGGGGASGGGGGAGGGTGTLATSAADKRTAAKYLGEQLLPHTASAGRMVDGGGPARPPLVAAAPPSVLRADSAMRGLSDWAAAAGVTQAVTTWQDQVSRLMSRLGREREALGEAKSIFRSKDLGAYTELNSVPVTPLAPRSPFDGM